MWLSAPAALLNVFGLRPPKNEAMPPCELTRHWFADRFSSFINFPKFPDVVLGSHTHDAVRHVIWLTLLLMRRATRGRTGRTPLSWLLADATIATGCTQQWKLRPDQIYVPIPEWQCLMTTQGTAASCKHTIQGKTALHFKLVPPRRPHPSFSGF